MGNPAKHIIHKINLDIDVPSERHVKNIQENIRDFLENHLFPIVEDICSSSSSLEQYTAMNTLDIDIDIEALSFSQTPEELITLFSEQFQQGLSKKIQATFPENPSSQYTTTVNYADEKEQVRISDINEKYINVFFYYLNTGFLPWYASVKDTWFDEKILLQSIKKKKDQCRQLFFEFAFQKSIWPERLIKQFSPGFIILFLDLLFPKIFPEEIKPIHKDKLTQMQKPMSNVLEKVLLELQQFILSEKSFGVAITISEKQALLLSKANEIFTQEYFSSPQSTEAQMKISEQEKKVSEKEGKVLQEGIFVQHAGLILLHPFLQYFFNDFNLVDKNNFKGEEERDIAIHLLYYLATKKEHPTDYQLIMEKFMIGTPMYQPVSRHIRLTNKMKKESETLLKACISHWKALKNTSTDGLREGFIQREGKLILDTDNRLIIEKKSMDILLDQLPWNYSIIQLPWLKDLFYVEWN